MIAQKQMDLPLGLPGRWSETGVEFPEKLTEDEWTDIGQKLRRISGAIQWWIGDWLAYGEHKWGEKHSRAAELTGEPIKTLVVYQWVSKRVQFLKRLRNLTWSHHLAVASIESPEQQSAILERAAAESWTVSRTRLEIIHVSPKTDGKYADPVKVRSLSDLPEGHFKTIYADPPWPYSNQATRASTGNHYETMTMQDILDLPVADRCFEKAHLWLWTTNAFLPHSFAVMDAWGFEYKSVVIWHKPQMGIGNYVRVCHEYLMLGVRGGIGVRDSNQRSVITHNRMGHSEKPEVFRKLIEKLSIGPHLELFGRKEVSGWTVWGNEIESMLLS